MQEHPTADNEQIAAAIREMVPGAKTSAASVSSMKSRMKREGATFDGDSADNLVVPALTASTSSARKPSPIGGGRYAEHDPDETLEAAKERISSRYDSFSRMSMRAVNGDIPSLIVSGPPGLGKSHTVSEALKTVNRDERTIDEVSGTITAVGLYIALWNCREGGVLVLDDCDDVFQDESALNILKAVLDSTPVRRVSWRKRANWLDELEIDDSFDFQGTVIFLTNVDFEAAIASGNRKGKHFEALLDRSMYLSLTLRARRDFMIRIRQVSEGENGMLQADKTLGLTEEETEEVLEFVSDNQLRFYNLSLRLVRQVAQCMKFNPENWKDDVRATKMTTL